MFAAVADARDRFLRPGGIVIPQAIKLFAAPVQSAYHHRYAEFFRGGRPYGLDLSVFGETDHVFVTTFDPECLVSDPVVVATCDVSVGYPNEVIDATVEFAISAGLKIRSERMMRKGKRSEGRRRSKADGHDWISVGFLAYHSAKHRDGVGKRK